MKMDTLQTETSVALACFVWDCDCSEPKDFYASFTYKTVSFYRDVVGCVCSIICTFLGKGHVTLSGFAPPQPNSTVAFPVTSISQIIPCLLTITFLFNPAFGRKTNVPIACCRSGNCLLIISTNMLEFKWNIKLKSLWRHCKDHPTSFLSGQTSQTKVVNDIIGAYAYREETYTQDSYIICSAK